jgi:hypothetical protein
MSPRPLLTMLAVLSFACGDGPPQGSGLATVGLTGAELSTGTGSMGPVPGTSSGQPEGTSTGTGAAESTGGGTTQAATSEADTGAAETGPPPAVKTCAYPASGGPGMQELMVAKGSPQRLKFTVAGLPEPGLVVAATLRYRSYDADHPGEEGEIFVNGGRPIALPADPAWENAEAEHAVDVGGRTVAGDNAVEFGAGSFDGGTFYRIGQVRLEVEATIEACPEPPPPPAEARELGWQDAIYTQRHNWALRCDFMGGYAYTAKGEDQIPLDCEGLYAPDGTTHGTATFLFEDVAPGSYEITIKSRHTPNRNPKGALFVVGGEGKRIHQDDDLDFWVDTWGTKQLAGDVEVVLDSTMEVASDSVIWVRLSPV